jgi:hypothetical protein
MDLTDYFNEKSLVKTRDSGLHFEQKTTPDLIWCVAFTIVDLIKNNSSLEFSDKDIRGSNIFNSLMQDYFSKPPQENAENEYNKVSSYQLGLLAFAGVLEQTTSRPKKFIVKEFDILSFLAINDLNASKFLGEYTEKFLKDNGLIDVFNKYKNNPNQNNHLLAKESYWNWAKINTGVRGEDRKHTYRVFNKIFNIFCNRNRIPGEDASNITAGPCPYSFLIYNRKNFRDKDKPVGMTRQEYKTDVLSSIDNEGVVGTLLKKAKDSVRDKYNGESEIKDPLLGYHPDQGVHIHHILPQHSYPEFSLSKENLIALTPGQHLSRAHIRGSTKTINFDFQKICLKTKFSSIKDSYKNNDGFYDLQEFINIINTCFDWDIPMDTDIIEVEEKMKQL